jgi:hypothetical protein
MEVSATEKESVAGPQLWEGYPALVKVGIMRRIAAPRDIVIVREFDKAA